MDSYHGLQSVRVKSARPNRLMCGSAVVLATA